MFLKQRNRNAESLTAVEAVCEIRAQTHGTVATVVVAEGLQQLQVMTQRGSVEFMTAIPLLLCRD